MRKFLLSLAALFVGATAFAQTEFSLAGVTLTGEKSYTATQDGITITLADDDSATANSGFLKFYGTNTTITVEAEEGKTISSVVFDGYHYPGEEGETWNVSTTPTVEYTLTAGTNQSTYSNLACSKVVWLAPSTNNEVEISKITVTLASEPEPEPEPTVVKDSVDFQFYTDAGFGAITITTAGAANTGDNYECSKEDFTISGTYGYVYNKKLSVFKNGTAVITAPEETLIDSVAVTYNKGCYPFKELLAGVSTDSKTTAITTATYVPAESADTVKFSNASAGKTEVREILIYCHSTAAVAKPAFSVAAGSYYDAQSVEITCATEGAEIYYTLSDTVAATKYTEALNIAETTTVKAYAVLGTDTSAVATAEYVIAKKYANLAALVAAGEPTTTGEKVIVTLNNEVIDSLYFSGTYRNGIYLTAADSVVEIYCKNVPEAWEVGGSVSGTVKGVWKNFKGTWEVCPETWDGITYYEKPLFANGEYYLYNVGAHAYMNHGSSWGTHVTVDGAGCAITLKSTAGAYTLHHAGIAANKFQTEDGWSDNVAAGKFTFEQADSASYYLKCANGKYYYWAGGVGDYGDEAVVGDKAETDAYKWVVIKAADREALVENADVTYLIANPDFNAYTGKTNGWTGDLGLHASSAEQQTYYTGQFAEKWTASSGNLGSISEKQTVTLPQGKYRLSVNANAELQGSGAGTNAYVFAGDEKTALGLFGTYSVEFITTGAALEIGIKTESTTANWVSFDKVRLTYLGNPIDELAATVIADYNSLLEKKMNDSIKTVMTNAYNTFTGAKTQDNLNALADAVNAAKTSVEQYAATKTALDACDAKAAALTETGKAKYAELVADIKTAYEAGTMNADKSADVNAAYKTAVMAQTEVGAEFIDAAPANVKDNWTGATGMLVPNWANATPYTFAEHYQGSEIAAGVVLSQTIEGLPVGNYEVTLALAASYTSGRGFEAATGDGIAAGFANDSIKGIPVVERTGLAADGASVVTVTTSTADGKIVYGLKNIANGGNWYAATVTSIKYVGVPAVEFPTMTIAFDSLTNILTFTPSDTTFYYYGAAAPVAALEEMEMSAQDYVDYMTSEQTYEELTGEYPVLVKGKFEVDLTEIIERLGQGEYIAFAQFFAPNLETSELTTLNFTVGNDTVVYGDTIEHVITRNAKWYDYAASQAWVQLYQQDANCAASICTNSTRNAGEFALADLDMDYTYLYMMGETNWREVEIIDAHATIAISEAGVVTGDLWAVEAETYNVYHITISHDPSKPVALTYDEESNVEMTFAASDIIANTASGSTTKTITFRAMSDSEYLYLVLYADSTDADITIPAGEYTFASTKEAGTALISTGVSSSGSLNPSYAATFDDSSFKEIWFLVNGKVTVEKGGTADAPAVYMVIEGTNSLGKTVKVTVGEPAPLVSTDLTADMYHVWTAADATGEITETTPWCDYVLNESTGMPYGNGNVDWLQYVDLSKCVKLEITTTAGTPRALFNRKTADGQAPDNMIDCGNNAAQRELYMTEENGVFTIDLAKIVADQGYAHLHTIKGANWANVTVTAIKIYAKSETDFPAGYTAISEIGAEQEETSTFNLQGQKVSAKKAGEIYINNGKLILVK